MSARARWGDAEEDIENTLPPKTIRGPDEHGVKIVTEYVRNDKGDAMKRTTKLKVVTVEKKVYLVGRLAAHG